MSDIVELLRTLDNYDSALDGVLRAAADEIERLRKENKNIGKGAERNAHINQSMALKIIALRKEKEDEIEQLRAQLQTHVVANLKLSDEIERLRSSFAAADEALAPCSSALEDCDQENQRLRDVIDRAAKAWLSIDGISWEGDVGDAMVAAVKEIKRLREIREPGSCECGIEDACRFAQERDEARAEIERLRGLLREIVDQSRLADMYRWDNDLYERVREAIGDAD